MVNLRRLALAVATQLTELQQGLQVTVLLGTGEGQHHVFPDAGAHGPYGQLFGVLHGEHGDRDRGLGVLDFQQQPQASCIGAIEVHADHVGLFPDGKHRVFGRSAVASPHELVDEFMGGPIMGQIEP
ncbi:hypothetical protein D3C73_1095940 [compost metagenome]